MIKEFDYRCTMCGHETTEHSHERTLTGSQCTIKGCAGLLENYYTTAPPIILKGKGWPGKDIRKNSPMRGTKR